MSNSSRPHAPLVAAVLLAGAVLACDAQRDGKTAFPTEQDRFARAYIHTLHDSGVSAVLGRTRRESVAVPAFVFGLDAMGRLLPLGPIDTVQLEKYEADTARADAMRLTYVVRGQPQPAEVRVTVVPENGRLVMDEVAVSRRAP